MLINDDSLLSVTQILVTEFLIFSFPSFEEHWYFDYYNFGPRKRNLMTENVYLPRASFLAGCAVCISKSGGYFF